MSSQKRLILISKVEETERLKSFANELQRESGMSGERKKDVLLVLHEAAMNAIVHGNRLDPEKHVTITVQIDPERLLISVRDEGEGFDPAQLADPLEPENIMKQSGRGIFLIRHYAYKVHYSKEGNEVDIIMHI